MGRGTSGGKDAERGLVKGASVGALPRRAFVPASWHLWFSEGRGRLRDRGGQRMVLLPPASPPLHRIRVLEEREP